ncbi:hypothetical protein D1BOALGB6SA_9252, partial [Olavius sp. associated proteobacterium Delta 1]
MAVVVIVKASFFIEVLAGIYSDARCPLKSTFFLGGPGSLLRVK